MLAGAQRHHDPDHCEKAGVHVSHGVPASYRFPRFSSGDAQEAARALDNQIHRRFVARGPLLAIPRYRTVHEPRITLRRGVITETEPAQRSGTEVLDQDVDLL